MQYIYFLVVLYPYSNVWTIIIMNKSLMCSGAQILILRRDKSWVY